MTAGGDDSDHRADIRAVGATLHESLTGTPPFTDTFQQVVRATMAITESTRWLDPHPGPVSRQ